MSIPSRSRSPRPDVPEPPDRSESEPSRSRSSPHHRVRGGHPQPRAAAPRLAGPFPRPEEGPLIHALITALTAESADRGRFLEFGPDEMLEADDTFARYKHLDMHDVRKADKKARYFFISDMGARKRRSSSHTQLVVKILAPYPKGA